MSDRVKVSVFDPATGETDEAELDPNSYILLTGEHMEVASYQQYANGTVQLTIKRVPGGRCSTHVNEKVRAGDRLELVEIEAVAFKPGL